MKNISWNGRLSRLEYLEQLRKPLFTMSPRVLSLAVRRYHDIGESGTTIIIIYVMYWLSVIVLFYELYKSFYILKEGFLFTLIFALPPAIFKSFFENIVKIQCGKPGQLFQNKYGEAIILFSEEEKSRESVLLEEKRKREYQVKITTSIVLLVIVEILIALWALFANVGGGHFDLMFLAMFFVPLLFFFIYLRILYLRWHSEAIV